MRTALLPTPGDPFLLAYWFQRARAWRPYIDRLIVCVSCPQDFEVRSVIRQLAVEHDAEVFFEASYDHGHAMQSLLQRVREGVVMFIEDDFFLLQPGFVDEAFRSIESGAADIAGIPRGSMSQELVKAGNRYYPGPGLWPTMLLAEAERFKAVTVTFSAWNFQPWEQVLGINHVTETVCGVDTFGIAAMQMQEGARLRELPSSSVQYPAEEYVHVGSLSSGPSRSHRISTAMVPHVAADLHPDSIESWALRTVWWMRFYQSWRRRSLLDCHRHYGEHIASMRRLVGEHRFQRWKAKSARF